MAQSKGLPFVVTLNEKEGLPQSTDQKKEIEGEISKEVVYVYASEAGLLTTMSFWVSSAVDCGLYRWRLFVYFTFPSI